MLPFLRFLAMVESARWALTIVGVVPDLMAAGVQEQWQDGIYASVLHTRSFGIRMMVRGGRDDAPSIGATGLMTR